LIPDQGSEHAAPGTAFNHGQPPAGDTSACDGAGAAFGREVRRRGADDNRRHHDVYEDADTIAFLSRYPTLRGYCLVAPKRHVESWVSDLNEAQFLALQGVVYRVAKAVAMTVPTERIYSLSLGSQQGNAHLHWHIAPLPPGVPYHQQQFHALMAENGVLDVTDRTQASLARAIRSHL